MKTTDLNIDMYVSHACLDSDLGEINSMENLIVISLQDLLISINLK